ncbi:MAG: choice-of-anchor Q domain-containing protein, partial [Anaerolineae bacterium]
NVAAGSTATLEATLWHDNGADTGGDGAVSTGAVNVFGDPRFADPSAWDYHITVGSPAIDSGVLSNVPTDIDGDERPQETGYDIGADEYVTPFTVYLPLVLR